jgi:hypothetical protein
MRGAWFGKRVTAVSALAFGASLVLSLGLAANTASAAQQRQINQVNPDLDTEDQLAPSQMKQPVPAAVPNPASAMHSTAPAIRHTGPAPAVETRTHTIACGGTFGKDSSHIKLAMTFDSRNITFTDVDANGTKVPASVLYPKDPKQRLEVWWANPAERSDTYLIVINGKSNWTAPGGLKLGLTLPLLEKLNHKPFKVKGFDKDGVATISDWDGGVLASLPGGCKSGLSLRADPKVPAETVAGLPADKEYSSTDPEIRAAKPSVTEILIGY